jgi:hypothetical protein
MVPSAFQALDDMGVANWLYQSTRPWLDTYKPDEVPPSDLQY